ncbi:MAG: hypothetical protein ACTSVK_17215 [Promethearchaeota archaeon]
MYFDLDSIVKELNDDIIEECNKIFREDIIPELKKYNKLNFEEKLQIYKKKIKKIEEFFSKKQFPLKDDYRLIYFESFNKRLLIGWEKNLKKYKIMLIIILNIFKIALAHIELEFKNKNGKFKDVLENKTIKEIIQSFIKEFCIGLRDFEEKESNSRDKITEEFRTYRDHVKHFFDF